MLFLKGKEKHVKTTESLTYYSQFVLSWRKCCLQVQVNRINEAWLKTSKRNLKLNEFNSFITFML